MSNILKREVDKIKVRNKERELSVTFLARYSEKHGIRAPGTVGI